MTRRLSDGEKRRHTKSRLGCRQCKERKVKCDELHPLCSNCHRRFPHLTQCDFDPPSIYTSTNSGARSSSQPSRAPVTTAPTPILQAPTPTSITISSPSSTTQVPNLKHSPNPPSNAPPLPPSTTPAPPPLIFHPLSTHPAPYTARVLDLRLFHQWTSSTSQTYITYLQHPVLGRWISLMPLWAFTYEFLLDFMLAFAALHLWVTDPITNPGMKAAYLYFMSEAGQKHRVELSNVNRENAQPLFVAAMMTNLQTKVLPLLRGEEEQYELPLQLFQVLNGMVATFAATEPFIDKDEMESIRKWSGEKLYPFGIQLNELSFLPREEREDVEMLLRVIDSPQLERLEKPVGVPEGTTTREVLRGTVALLGSVMFGWAAHEPESWTLRRIAEFTWQTPKGLEALLRGGNPVAMAVFARFFLQMRGRQEWFLRGVAEREVRGVASLMEREWEWLMEYPLKVIGVGKEAA